MATTKYDVRIPQSGTWRYVVGVEGGPDDLTGYVGKMEIRETASDAVALATIQGGQVVVNPNTRQVVVTVPSSVTATYTWSEAKYDLYVIGPTGDRWRVVEGNIRLSLTVTR